MPADYDDLASAFENLTGSEDGQETWYGEVAGNAEHWIDLYSETGITFESAADDVDAFENFLIAFYPQEGMAEEDWYYVRQEFYDMYQVDEHNIDWEAYRAAIGYD